MKSTTRLAIATVFSLAMLAPFAEAADNAANDIRWKSPTTGTHFRLLPGPVTAKEAEQVCASRGWDLLNFDYLSDEEKAQLLESPQLESLQWGVRFAGEPGEHRVAEVWGSSEFRGVQSSLLLYKLPGDPKARGRVIWEGSPKKQTLCMFQSPTWMSCRQAVECKQFGGMQLFFITEYGRAKPEAVARINKRFESISPNGTKCEMVQQEPYCVAIRPKLR